MAKNKQDEKQSAEAKSTETNMEQVNVRLRYDSMDTQFASQFIINASREEIIINLSPGYVAEPGTNERLLPIQNRIAMTPKGAARLAQTLNTVLRNSYGVKPSAGAEDTPTETEESGLAL